MSPFRLASAVLIGGSLGLFAAGCGGSRNADETAAGSEESAPVEGGGEAAAVVEEEAPVAAAPAPAPKAATNSAATDELLQLSQASPAGSGAAEAGGQPAAGGAPGGGGPPGGGMGGMSIMGPGAGRPGGMGPGGPGGAPGAQGMAGMMGMGPGGMPKGYPGAGGGGPGGAGGPGAQGMAGMMGMGPGGMPKGYPGAGGGGPNPADMRSQYQASQGGGQAGMAGGAGPGGGAPGAPGGGASLPEPDYSSPMKGAETFLAAVKAKDLDRLADAVALRSVNEAVGKNQGLFRSILERSIEPGDLDRLSDIFKDMKIAGNNAVKSTGVLGVILTRTEEDGDKTIRTLEMRREKAGWKVRDFSLPRKIDNFSAGRTGGGNRPGGASNR